MSAFCPLVFSLEKGVFKSIFNHKKNKLINTLTTKMNFCGMSA